MFCSVASGMSFPALLAWIQVARAAVTTGKVEVEALVLQLPFFAQNQSLSLLLPIFLQGCNEALTLQGCSTTECGCQGAWCQQKGVFLCNEIIQVS